jgi:hypothetical protein
MFKDVLTRLGEGEALDLLDPACPQDGWKERGAAIAARIRSAGHPVALIAHGLAVPAAIAAATETPPALLVLSDGPVTRIDPVTRLLATSGPWLHVLLRPPIWERWLWSSAGLRRVVANPYVMDRDTVVALAHPLVAEQRGRASVRSYVRALADGLPDPALLRGRTRVVWGTEDILYPSSEADYLDGLGGGDRFTSVPGGRWMHPVERPWFLADYVRGEIDAAVAAASGAT